MNHFSNFFQQPTAMCKYVPRNPQKYDNWTCGYRNAIILLSYFNIESSVAELQSIIEHMWNLGFDEDGRGQLFPLKGTQKWIGTTEIYLILLYFRIDSIIVDMPLQSKFPLLTKRVQIEFLFSLADPFVEVETAPIYFQYEGHSCLIVGVDETGFYILDTINGATYQTYRELEKKNDQYQILIVKGHIVTEPSKIINSIRL